MPPPEWKTPAPRIAAAENQVAAAHAQLQAAEANDVKAQDDLVRYKALVDKQEVAAQVYDQAVADGKSQHRFGSGGARK